MEERLNQLNAKLELDKELAEKIFSLETAEEVQSFLKAQGLEFSLEEINSLRDALIKAGKKGELSDTDLEDVAGGWVFGAISAGFAAASFTHNVTRGRW